MRIHRRTLLAVVPAAAATGIAPARAQDATRTERTVGRADAKTVVQEHFSLTCGHCAAFAATTLPSIKTQLVDTGKVRFIYRDFPLDQVALTAAMVARHLPAERYEAFILALLSTQDRWAFARGADPTAELWKMAALAGMGRAAFDAAVADNALRDWILKEAQADQERWKIDSTPSFVVNGQRYAGDMSFDAFRKLVPE